MRHDENFRRMEIWGAEFVQVLLPLQQNCILLSLLLLFSVAWLEGAYSLMAFRFLLRCLGHAEDNLSKVGTA
jgi:hypothetical protein